MAETTRGPEQAWWALMLSGIAAILLGVYALTSAGLAIFALVSAIALYWFARGVIEVADVGTAPRLKRGSRLVAAIVSIVGGAVVLGYPIVAGGRAPLALSIPLLGVVALASGIAYVAHGVTGGGGGSTVLGVFDLLLAVVLIGQMFAAVPILRVGVQVVALLGGIIVVGMAFALRGHQHSEMHRMAPA